MDFRKADFGLFRCLLGGISWNKALEGNVTQEHWLIFKETVWIPRDHVRKSKALKIYI